MAFEAYLVALRIVVHEEDGYACIIIGFIEGLQPFFGFAVDSPLQCDLRNKIFNRSPLFQIGIGYHIKDTITANTRTIAAVPTGTVDLIMTIVSPLAN